MTKLDKVLEEFYEIDEQLNKAREELLKITLAYEELYDKRLLGSGMATMALKEAEVRGAMREDGIYIEKAEKELEVRNLYNKWQTRKTIISALISMQYEKNYG